MAVLLANLVKATHAGVKTEGVPLAAGSGAVWIDYANEELMLLNTFVIAVATWFTPLIAARAIKQTRRAYSTKSWP
jgi:hypothetical protein